METAAERLSELGKWMQEQEFLSVTEACKRADASPATIRRDFAQLVAQGVAERHRGGIRRSRRDALSMVPFAVREMRMAAEKSAIAAAAAKLIEPGDVVFVDGGTSTLHLADHLGRVPVRVITNSLRLAVALGERSYEQPVELHLSGGYLLPRSGLLVGPQAREGIARYHARWAFLSVGGIGADGVWNNDELVAEIEQAMMTAAERVVVLADRSKIGARTLLHVASLARVHLLITDAAGAEVEPIRNAGCAVESVAVERPAAGPQTAAEPAR